MNIIESLAQAVAGGMTIEEAAREMGVRPLKEGRERVAARVAELLKSKRPVAA